MNYKKNIFILFFALAISGINAQSVTFNYTGAVQTWTVPCGVTSVTVDMAGAEGGNSTGTGGRVQCVYATTPSTLFNIYVGGQGAPAASGAAGGWNGGGNAGAASGGSYGSGGGGASDIRVGGTALANRVIVAGGGGGINTDNDNPGKGGGLTGENSNGCCNGCFASWATGGTQVAGGNDAVGSGTCCIFTATPNGSLGIGGNGAGPSSSCNNGDGGGGGGGGYYGGGGGGGYGSGAGGSSYTNASCSSVIHTQGFQSGNGYVTLKWIVLTDTGNVISPVTCNGGRNGKASSFVAGGKLPYTYSWAPSGGSSDTAIGLSAGTYTITVSDACGATSTSVVSITEPTAISITSVSTPDNGSHNGTATVTATGGVMPYGFLWSPGGNTTASISGKDSGMYCCTVSDSNGCKDSICIHIKSIAGIENITSAKGETTIYPNPGSGLFTLQMCNGNLIMQNNVIQVYNILGETVYSKIMASNQSAILINLNNQPSGVYFYRLLEDNGNLKGKGKIILEK